MDQPPFPRLGGATLLAPLARRPQAALWTARTDDGRRVVLKLHEPGEGERGGLAESALLGLAHPSLATCFAALRVPGDGRLATFTPFVAGRPLDARALPRDGRAGAAAERLAARLLSALDALHGAGFLHRDLKAANVHVDPAGERPLLLDFGLACPLSAARDAPLAGTPAAFAPELFAGASPSPASELWAAGQLLAEALLGERLFAHGEPERMRREREGWSGLGAERRARLGSPALAALLDRLLAPDPAARPESAEAALHALPLDEAEWGAPLLRERARARWHGALAAVDPLLVGARAAAAARVVRVVLLRDAVEPAAAAHAALLEAFAPLAPIDDDLGLALRVAAARRAPSAADVADLAARAAARQPFTAVLDAEAVGPAVDALVARLESVPGLTVERLSAPDGASLAGCVRAAVGEQPVLVARLAAAPPASWGAARAALDELLRDDVLRPARRGARLDEAALPAGWPEPGDRDPAASRTGAERQALGLLALAGAALPVARLLELCPGLHEASLADLQAAGFVARVDDDAEQAGPRVRVADERLRRRLLAALDPSTAARRALAAALPDADAARLVTVLLAEPADADDPATTERLLDAARELRREGRLELAGRALGRALAGLPDAATGAATDAATGAATGAERGASADAARLAATREALHVERVDVLIRASDDGAAAALAEAEAACGATPRLRLRGARLAALAGRREEAMAAYDALDLASLGADDAVLALQLRAELRRERGDVEGALADLREGLRRAGGGDNRRSMVLLERLGGVMAQLGRLDEAARAYERCLTMARALGHEALLWSPMNNLSRVLQDRGERARGLALQERAAELCELSGDRRNLWSVLNSLGARWLAMGRADPARLHLTRALALARELGHAGQEAVTLNNLGEVLAHEGRHAESEAAFETSLRLRRERGDGAGPAAVHLARGAARLRRGDRAGARADLEAARGVLERSPAPARTVELELLAARLAWADGAEAATIAAAERALGGARALDMQREALAARDLLARAGGRSLEDLTISELPRGPWLAPLLLTRAEHRAAAGQWVEAEEDADAAFSLLSDTPDGAVEAECLARRLRLDLDRADRLLAAEEPDFVEVGALLSRVPRDLARARDLAEQHGLDPLGERLRDLAARHGALEEGDGMTGLSALAGRLRDLERLVEINKQLNSERDTQKLLELIIDSAVEITGAARGFLILFEGKAEEFRAARNIDESSIQHPEFQVSHSVARKVAREGRALLTANALDDPELGAAASISELKLLSILCVPLASRSGSLGAVYLDHPQVVGRFDEGHLGTVTALAEQAAIALENARLSEGLARTNSELSSSREEIRRLNEALQERLEQREAQLEEARETLDASRRAQALRYDYANIITRSPRMHEALDLLDRVTDTDYPVVIHGESGTGKELMARACHFNGPRKDRNFLSINCAAIPEQLIESELFGSKKGAFSGADRDRKGLFAQAHLGTLFLDEIGDMSPSVQTRLLRVLQEGEFLPVGGREVVKVDVRILCATHRDLAKLVEQGSFREDLYFRLAVARLHLPPLRERGEDIGPLLEHFLERHGAGGRRVEPEALALLRAQPWPGNVRELENFVMNLLLLDRDGRRVSTELVRRVLGDGPGHGVNAPGVPAEGSLKERLEAFERAEVQAALEANEGNKSAAARQLGVSVRTLYKMLERLGIGA